MDSLMALGTSYDQLLHLQRPVFRSRPIRGHYCEVISAVSTNQRPLSRPTFYMSHYGYAVYKPLIYFDGLLDHWLILGDWGAVAAGDQP